MWIKKNPIAAVTLMLAFVAVVLLGYRLAGQQNSPKAKLNEPQLDVVGAADSAPPSFSLQPGWYDAGTTLSIEGSGPSGAHAKLVYTLDGSEPTIDAALYRSPISLNKTGLVRAKEFYDDGTAGAEAVGFFGSGVKPALPVVVVIANPDLLWSDESGIMVIGKHGNQEPPYNGANFWGDTEIPARFQWFDQSGKLSFESGAGMELFGGESRMQPQKSLELKAKKKFGEKNFQFRFFEQQKREVYNSIILRNGGQDFPLTHMRDSVSSLIAKPILEDVQAYRPVAVYLNDRYFGIYDLREKMDEKLLADRHDINAKSIDLLESDGEVKAGGNKRFKQLLEALHEAQSSSKPDVGKLEMMVDTQSLFDYMIVEAYIGNTDWPDHNIRYWRSDEQDGKFRWLLYDADLSFGEAAEPSLSRLLSSKLAKHPSVGLLQTLLKDSSLREQFLSRFGLLLNGPLSPESVTAAIVQARTALEPEMAKHQERWEGSMSRWHAETDKLLDFASNRPAALAEQLQQMFQLTDKDMSVLRLK
ncbi:CotH kinase family protein [Paenibacillus sp. CF384]|uniref:CotH kinase family protein n=1 Tax=Paenibacillus sp. CF384 TaxID=1884382 RepID=UPI0008946191|nr:CotH kinase family protein [Paenibacillus sp. CF384]SDW66428.1 Fn3 associated [Paenibacillus sp. CF384]